MAKRRRFSISTFAELFVLLAIVFMVQTIANITLGKSTPETDAVRGTRIVLAQYPYVGLADVSALGRRADHLRYISVGEVGLVFSGVSGCHLTAFELAQPLSEQTDQGCRDIPRYVSERYNASLESQSEIDIFVDRVFRLYGIRILVDWAPGVQKRIILSYSEEISVQDIAVRVGLCVCTIESAPTEVPDSWRIPFRMFEKAHPLVIDVLSLSSEGDAERRFGVMFSNVADFQEKRPKGEYATRYKFNAAGCLEPVVEDEPIRGDFVREVSISWPRIVSEVASDV